MSHVGDIVDKNTPAQWQLARSCMDVIHRKVPYGISVGNHGMTGEGLSGFRGSIHKLKAVNVCVLEVKSQSNRLAGQR